MKFVYSARADREDRDAFEYLLKDSPDVADSFDKQLQSAIEYIQKFPNSGARVGESNVRSFTLKGFRYRIFYCITDDVLTVLSIFHTSRDPEEMPTSQ